MNKIDTQLEKIKQSGTMGLMTHVVIGYPTIEDTKKIIKALAEGGSDFIELQIPFSDPIADGPTIMYASEIALQNGVTTKKGMEIMSEMTQLVDIPLVFMCYYNTLFAYGVEKFCEDAAQAGASGMIVPDVPPEEEQYEKLAVEAGRNNLYFIRIVSPASSQKRLQKNASLARGFVYCVSRFGVTGAKNTLAPELQDYLANVDKEFKIPKAVGFGISSPQQVHALKGKAEIAVVGSSIIDKVKAGNSYKEITAFIKALKS